ncbi:hypothetical protein KAR48_02765 [bacterium]|nr:hypothetical protein [bacterium]
MKLEFFPSFQNKDDYYDTLSRSDQSISTILLHVLALVVILFAYGLIMGCYNSLEQALTSGIKLPLLYTLVLTICFPAFFMIQHVLGSQLHVKQMVSIILAGFVLSASIMLSFSPIIIFFMMTGDNYPFLKLLHVAIFLFSGFFGMRIVTEALHYACDSKGVYPKIGVKIFRIWIFIMAFVAAQLSWTLRPFIGNKGEDFQLFRNRKGNIYQTLAISISDIFTGKTSAATLDETTLKTDTSEDITKVGEHVE